MDGAALGFYGRTMGSQWLVPVAIFALTLVTMELVAAGVHRWIMHGWGWGWHRSHHEPRTGRLETNDLYSLIFAGLGVVLVHLAGGSPVLWAIALGVMVYGLLYALLHDGLIHRRFAFFKVPRRGYLKRLVQAHRLHHAVRGREGAVSFGFLYAPPLPQLLARLPDGERR